MFRVTGFKIRHLFLPYLLLSVGLLAGYSLLNWLLVVKTGWLHVDEDIATYWLPFGLAGVLVFALIRPRLRVLVLNKERCVPFLYGLAAACAIAAPAVVAQLYLQSTAGAVAHVRSAADIASAPSARYYTADEICVDRNRMVGTGDIGHDGSNDPTVTIRYYAAAPVCGANAGNVWIVVKFRKDVPGNLSDAERNAEFNAIVQQSERTFARFDPSQYRFLERIGQGDDRRSFEKAIRKSGAASPPVVLVPRAELPGRQADALRDWIWKSFGLGAALWLVLVMITPLYDDNIDDMRLPEKDGDAVETLKSLFLPRLSNYGLPLLVDVNIAVFLVMAFYGLGFPPFHAADLMAWGANNGSAVRGGEIYRLISSQFVHSGLMHLASNMYGLIFAGIFLSPIARNRRLVLCYLVTGLGGSIASAITHPGVVSVGASGAIMGLWGILLVMSLLQAPGWRG
jgi:rhomboid protease GluP